MLQYLSWTLNKWHQCNMEFKNCLLTIFAKPLHSDVQDDNPGGHLETF